MLFANKPTAVTTATTPETGVKTAQCYYIWEVVDKGRKREANE